VSGLSFVPLILGALVWWDNKSGFRDAGAFADLLAAVFGMVSVVWLVAAVLLQHEELALQRQELSLQRQEVCRIADETNRQASLMNAQLKIQRQTNFVDDFRSFLLSEEQRIQPLRDEIEEIINKLACAASGVSRDDVSVQRYFGNHRIRVTLKNLASGEEHKASVRYAAVASRVVSNPRIRRAHVFWRKCRRVELGYWFRAHLAHSVGPTAGLTVYQIMALTNVAARARW
jgi:hypothetical protein